MREGAATLSQCLTAIQWESGNGKWESGLNVGMDSAHNEAKSRIGPLRWFAVVGAILCILQQFAFWLFSPVHLVMDNSQHVQTPIGRIRTSQLRLTSSA